MSAATQALINKQNATHSTGPRTEEGKSRSKFNALNHGLASSAVVLPYESQEDYNALRAAFEETHQPGSELERHLLGRMVDCWWRLQRAYRVEGSFLAQRESAVANEDGSLEGDGALAFLFSDPKEMARMRLFMRYLGAAERAWARAESDFRKARRERLEQQKAEAESLQELTGQWLRSTPDTSPVPCPEVTSDTEQPLDPSLPGAPSGSVPSHDREGVVMTNLA